ncbi:hypothetical protein E2C01_074089 [Portunus trituberculatus]|uniref:Uncharacterized protein n=1 Tax=Portunus trituberculatus TaxID=210409 RepID=A0A5B7IFE7_PORTR|nr:hypothetical protein [Portunus trituberculatus]
MKFSILLKGRHSGGISRKQARQANATRYVTSTGCVVLLLLLLSTSTSTSTFIFIFIFISISTTTSNSTSISTSTSTSTSASTSTSFLCLPLLSSLCLPSLCPLSPYSFTWDAKHLLTLDIIKYLPKRA